MVDQREDSLAVPEGFERIPEGLGFADRLQPFYRRIGSDGVSFGLYVDQQHLNLMGICHGGALMTLADITAATSINRLREEPSPSPTINLSFDFVSPGKKGRWLHTRSDHVEIKRRFGFCAGVIVDGDQLVMRYSGSFYFADKRMMEVGERPPAFLDLVLGHDGVAD